LISGNPNIRDLPNAKFKDYFTKYRDQKIQFTKDVEQGAQSQPGTYEATVKKIVNFFQNDSSKFYKDLLIFDRDNSERVPMQEFFHFLETVTLKLSKEEQSAILTKFRAVPYTRVNVEYITSMIFYGRSNLQISHIVQQPFCVQKFFTQIRSEMNLTMKGSYDIFK